MNLLIFLPCSRFEAPKLSQERNIYPHRRGACPGYPQRLTWFAKIPILEIEDGISIYNL